MPVLRKTIQSLILGNALSSVLLFAQGTSWTKEPESFRGAKFLASETEVKSKLRIDNCVGQNNEEKTCFFFFNLANTPINAVAVFQRDALVSIGGVFSPSSFKTMLDVLIEAYDKPSISTVDRYQWAGKAITIKLERLGSEEQKDIVKAISSGFCEAQRAAARDIDAFAANLDKEQDAERERNRVDLVVRADASMEALRRRAANYDKNATDAELRCRRFSSSVLSVFTVTENTYAVQVERRQREEKQKAANSLK